MNYTNVDINNELYNFNDELIRLDKVIDIIKRIKAKEPQLKDYKIETIEKTNGDILNKYYDKNDELFAIKENDGEIVELTSVPDFPSVYADLERGKIWIDSSNRFSNARTANRFGYLYSTFNNKFGEKAPISLHSLIMSASTQMKPEEWLAEGLQINHIDGNKTNNRVDNLELVTAKENVAHYYKHNERSEARRLSIDEVQRIKYTVTRLKLINRYKQSDVANHLSMRLGVDYVNVYNVLVGKTYANVELDEEQKLDIESRVKQQVKEDIEKDIEILSEMNKA